MAITLQLHVQDKDLLVHLPDSDPTRTALSVIPFLPHLQADPFTYGQSLTAALGSEDTLW